MTGRIGGQRRVNFPILSGEPSKEPPPGYPCSQLIVYQNLKRDAKLLLDKLITLGVDENVHGELMVLISANRRIEENLELLLAVEEGYGLKAHSAGGPN